MKLIAKRNFRNPGRQIKLERHEFNEDHIHKGAVFEIGGNKPYEALNGSDQKLVMELNFADCIGDASNPEIVKAVQKELAEEQAREEARTESHKAPSKRAKAEAAAVAD